MSNEKMDKETSNDGKSDDAANAPETKFTSERNEAIEYCRDLYKESRADFRYFGSLRAVVSYPPALLVGALVTSNLASEFPWTCLSAFMILVFVLIFLANYLLQIEQRDAKTAARRARTAWEGALNKHKASKSKQEEVDVVDLTALRRPRTRISSEQSDTNTQNNTPKPIRKPDGSSILLLIFLSGVAVAASIGAYYRSEQSGDSELHFQLECATKSIEGAASNPPIDDAGQPAIQSLEVECALPN